ncbi:GPN-loop GTPase 1-like isoform X2 [Dinothrombium tinctorium]|uniref:GPN-loop GTPase n=1 Tax=Dinothrombium tinctorium TaxID=1965070 RepID=A0A3S3PAA6_9ACAR|nr:GPN-loop GTPase 1-like isoform X2 [Dinothrombium tinctorium]
MMESEENAAKNAHSSEGSDRKPICVIVLGMAGSGKTSLVQRVTNHLYAEKCNPYVINLDPACIEVPYPANIDIRDTVKYKEVMKQFGLGPNGGIITSLNLFATRFDQIMKLIDKRKAEHKYVVFDTPGQIEVFTWSASGQIVTETLASEYPTVIVYVMDIVRNLNPITFMSNMLYACSILYKTKLPFLVVMNKVDIVEHKFALEWMKDFDAFQAALESDPSYSSNLARSMSLVLDNFYKNLNVVGFSAVNGDGVNEFFDAIEKCANEYEKDYRPEYLRIKKEAEEAKKVERKRELSSSTSRDELITFGEPETSYDIEDEYEEMYEEEKREYEEFRRQFNLDKKPSVNK